MASVVRMQSGPSQQRRSDNRHGETATRLSFAQYDESGRVKAHSFLGSAEDMAAAAGLPPPSSSIMHEPNVVDEAASAEVPEGYAQRRRSTMQRALALQEDREARALAQWDTQMAKWREQAEHISQFTGTPAEMLNMQTYELHRRKRELQDAVERAIPRKERGHGLLAGDGIDFWQPLPRSKTELSMSMTNPRRNRKSGMLFVGRPLAVYNEMRVEKARHPRPSWFSSTPYAAQRLEELDDELQDQLVFEPDTAHLIVKGAEIRPHTAAKSESSSGSHDMDEFERLEREIEEELADMRGGTRTSVQLPKAASGPRLTLRIEGERHSSAEESCRVLFGTVVNERKHRVLLLENTGSTVMYYRWQQVERENALGRVDDDRQRFFLDFEPGVVLPGECRELTISYLSPNAGVFSEAWCLLIQPWAEKEMPVLSLCGVTDRIDTNRDLRQTIESKLERRHIENAMRSLVYDMISALRPRGPNVPASRWAPASVRFALDNPRALVANEYSADVAQALEDLFKRAFLTQQGVTPAAEKPSTSKGKRGKQPEASDLAVEVPPWDRQLETLRDGIMAVEDNTERENMLADMMRLTSTFSPAHKEANFVLEDGRSIVARETLVRMANRFESEAGKLRTTYHLPSLTVVVKPEESRKLAVPAAALAKKQDAAKGAKRAVSSRPKSSGIAALAGTEAEAEAPEPVREEDLLEYKARLSIMTRQVVYETIDTLSGLLAELPNRPRHK